MDGSIEQLISNGGRRFKPAFAKSDKKQTMIDFPESVAPLPPFGPIEGQKWFDKISSQ